LRSRIFPWSYVNTWALIELYLLPSQIRISLSFIGNKIRTVTVQKKAISVIGKPPITTKRDIAEFRTDHNLKTANSKMKLHPSFSPLESTLSHSSVYLIVLFAIIITLRFFSRWENSLVIEVNHSLNLFMHIIINAY